MKYLSLLFFFLASSFDTRYFYYSWTHEQFVFSYLLTCVLKISSVISAIATVLHQSWFFSKWFKAGIEFLKSLRQWTFKQKKWVCVLSLENGIRIRYSQIKKEHIGNRISTYISKSLVIAKHLHYWISIAIEFKYSVEFYNSVFPSLSYYDGNQDWSW